MLLTCSRHCMHAYRKLMALCCLLLFYLTLVLTSHNLQPQNIQLSLLENIPFCNNPAELTDLETYFMWTQTSQLITLSTKKKKWVIERQSYETALSLVKSAWIWTIQLKFISHLSIGSKAARDKVNQIAHVRKSRGSLGTCIWRLNEINVLRRLGRKRGYFQRWFKYSNAFEVLNARGKLITLFFF